VGLTLLCGAARRGLLSGLPQVVLLVVGALAFVSSTYFALSGIGEVKHTSADTCPVTGAEN
jgi:hypothetical protein